jgi:hypothetical protein
MGLMLSIVDPGASDSLSLIREYGLPLVALVVVAILYYRQNEGEKKDLRTQRDAANARADAALDVGRQQIAATHDLTVAVKGLTELVRDNVPGGSR